MSSVLSAFWLWLLRPIFATLAAFYSFIIRGGSKIYKRSEVRKAERGRARRIIVIFNLPPPTHTDAHSHEPWEVCAWEPFIFKTVAYGSRWDNSTVVVNVSQHVSLKTGLWFWSEMWRAVTMEQYYLSPCSFATFAFVVFLYSWETSFLNIKGKKKTQDTTFPLRTHRV